MGRDCFSPHASYPHPDLHIHDVAFGAGGIWTVNTRFNCLARPSDEHTFEPLWRLRFITDLVPEDRCHLNGLAMRDGKPAYVTALAESNTAGGWREHKASGGVVIDFASGEIVIRGLAFSGSHALIGLSGARIGLLEIASGCTELFDIRVLTGQLRPAIVHPDAPDALEAISVPGCYFWLCPENLIKD